MTRSRTVLAALLREQDPNLFQEEAEDRADEILRLLIPPGRCGDHFEPDPERRYTCELLAGHAGWHQETRWHEDLTPQTVSWSPAV